MLYASMSTDSLDALGATRAVPMTCMSCGHEGTICIWLQSPVSKWVCSTECRTYELDRVKRSAWKSRKRRLAHHKAPGVSL